jgi:hypothetical protein
MKRLLCFLTAVFVAATSVHAGSKPKASSPASKPTPDPTKDPIVQHILRDLQPSHPHLTAKEIVQTSNADLRKMYVDIYTKQGMKLMEAKEKAASIPLKN